MGNGAGNGVRAARLTAMAAIVVAIAGNATVYLDGRAARQDARADRHARVARENQFFRSQCHRDFVRDNVVILALQDAEERARSSIPDPARRADAIRLIQSRIDIIETFRGNCEASIPD